MLIIEATGVKGGAGRSTISALLALSLAKRGENVVLLDLDPLGWSSYLMEARGEGLIPSIQSGHEGDLWTDIKVENQTIRVIKMLGNGSKLDDALSMILSDARLRGEFEGIMSSAIQERFGVIVIDSSIHIREGSKILQNTIAESIKVPTHIRKIYVTDMNRLDVDSTLNAIKDDKDEILGTVINMVLPIPSFFEVAETYAYLFKGIVAVVPFIEALFNASSITVSLIPPQIQELASNVFKPVPDFMLIM
ncbi:ParA family protein [Metallosphaera javensis (ex Sakai et al. 2022)]|uniref:ParA family protein n=1 Tax=Metallosphaera javensis (ex Sakai et al. 2022) TaxID=2775498 RepID=UPI00258584B5|nr:MAG: iron-sulfur cluster carrier protein [Metallosphaera javensis (ex Sakai et al. 2022)]